MNDFEIHPCFTVLKSHEYHDYNAELKEAEILAYLAIPIMEASIWTKRGHSYASYIVEKEMNSVTLLQGVSDHSLLLFQAAVKALRL